MRREAEVPEGHLSAIRAASRAYVCVCCFKAICLCVSDTSCLKAISFQILGLHLHLHVLLLLLRPRTSAAICLLILVYM
jgi:hypothetical protein